MILDPYGTNGAGIIPKLTMEDLLDLEKGVMQKSEAILSFSENIEARPYEHQYAPILDDPDLSRIKKGKSLFYHYSYMTMLIY